MPFPTTTRVRSCGRPPPKTLFEAAIRRDGGARHAKNGGMHPQEVSSDDEEQQHEAAGPKSGPIVQQAEGDGQHKTAQSADHADDAAHRPDVVRVIDRDMAKY